MSTPVLPLAREWIEMALLYALCLQLCKVLPLAREWIEIARAISSAPIIRFSLLRGSGLKSNDTLTHFPADVVLPLAREWIEIDS